MSWSPVALFGGRCGDLVSQSANSGMGYGGVGMSSFEDTVKNLLRMKPKPHKEEAPASQESQSEPEDRSRSKERSKR